MDYGSEKYKFTGEVSEVFLSKLVSLVKGKKVLDLGCGSGTYLNYFSDVSVGADGSPNNVNESARTGRHTVRMDFNNPVDFPEPFDLVFSCHVLEHVESPISYLRYAHRNLKKGGLLVLSVPNEKSLIHLKWPYFTGDGNHLYSFSMNNLDELLAFSGFELKSRYYDVHTTATKKMKLGPVFDFCRFVGPNPVREWLAWAFWIVAEKK
jgi:SAM-dependent methyltransferase